MMKTPTIVYVGIKCLIKIYWRQICEGGSADRLFQHGEIRMDRLEHTRTKRINGKQAKKQQGKNVLRFGFDEKGL